MHHEEIDTIIDGICQEYDSISDAFDFSDEPRAGEPLAERDKLPEDGEFPVLPDGGIGGTFRPSSHFGGFVNMFPANAYGPCRPDFLLVVPADPLRMKRSVRPNERERLRVRYFQNALRAIDRWATICRGKNIYLLTERWPVAPGITKSAVWDSELAPQNQILERVENLTVQYRRSFWEFERCAIEELDSSLSSSHLRSLNAKLMPEIAALKDLAGEIHRAHINFEGKIHSVCSLINAWSDQFWPQPLNTSTFHEHLQAFREAHPDVNFHIRLAAIPRQRPVRFRCLSGERWPQI